MNDLPLLFLDANTLASPVTRTLVISGARADALRWTWSKHVEIEADRHAYGRSSSTSIVRKTILRSALSPSAGNTRGLATKTLADRRVIADAIRAGARYLITSNVDDFAFNDLALNSMSAVNPDYFMALRFSDNAYYEGVRLLAEVQKDPSRTAPEVHRMLGRRHPYLAARFSDAYDTTPLAADPDQPSLLFRGNACICCDAHLESELNFQSGLCPQHMPLKRLQYRK